MAKNTSTDAVDTVVIGAGLAGLTAACYLARAGKSVTVFERASKPGGRAITQRADGFSLNLGPHALYRDGEAAAVLRELGVSFAGHTPGASGGFAIRGGLKHALPAGFLSLLTTGLLRLPAKLELGRLLAALPTLDTTDLADVSVADWQGRAISDPEVRALMSALVRLTTYTNADGSMSAAAALDQVKMALAGNVYYLDDGWQVLVDGLERAACALGVELRTASRVDEIEADDGVAGVRLADGTVVAARTVVVAATPAVVASLLSTAPPRLRSACTSAQPVQAACLDLSLSRLPVPRATFALGTDRPLYLSVHSAVARLAPAGAATLNVAKYLEPGAERDPAGDERELEELAELVQPGWRRAVVARRFLPVMTVSNAVVTAAGGGKEGRPPVEVDGIAGAYLAGDWVGDTGLLADASAASARRAAEACLAYLAATCRRAA